MIKAVIFDFDGVLCHDRFYKDISSEHQDLYNWIQDNIFGNKDLLCQWLRNEINTDGINKLIAENTGYKEEFLKDLLLKSLEKIQLDEKVFNLAKSLKEAHQKKIAIVTDNMDVFSSVTVKRFNLDKIFDVIINSADYGCLKTEQNGKLFDKALEFLNEKIENCLLIDDLSRKVEFFKEKGGQAYLYKNFAELNNFLRIHT